MSASTNLKKGVFTMLLLKILKEEDMYGYQLTPELNKRSEGKFTVNEGTLYPTLYRLLEKGFISERQEIVGKRLRKYYHLEPEGLNHLSDIIINYKSINDGIRLVMGNDILND